MDEPGIPEFTTSFPVEHGFINIANGTLHLEIPIASYPQRGSKLQYNARLVYDSRFWTYNANDDTRPTAWQPDGVGPVGPGVGWRLITDEDSGEASNSQSFANCACIPGSIGPQCQTRTTYSNFTYQEPNGTNHRADKAFKLFSSPSVCGGDVATGSAYASDNSGYEFVVTNGLISVYASDGTLVMGQGPAGSPAVRDTNGNFSVYSSGNLVDTLGRIPVIMTTSGNQVFVDYLNPQASRSRMTLTTGPLSLATQFGTGGNYTGTLPSLQTISFPDGSSYQFQYDSYGQITGITLPTGGQVTYGYTNTVAPNQVNRWLTSRMDSNNNTWTFAPVFTSCTAPCNPLTVTVTTPPYNDGTTTASDNHVYSFFFAVPNGGGGAWPAQIQYFRGSGTPLVTLTNEYNNGTNNSCQQPMGNSLVPVLVREKLAWPSGLSKKVEYCYDSNGINQISKKMWDYQPNGNFATGPDREIDTTYVTDPSYVSANILTLPLTSTTFGPGGTQVAQTTYAYNGGTLQPSYISTGHTTSTGPRGNVISITKWLNTTNGSIPSNTAWYDTGEVYQATDPLGHVSTFTYDSAFAGAYVTKICNSLSQCSYNGYDLSTGLLTSSTGINGSSLGDPPYTTNYTYDSMLRPLCTNAPDGGQRCVSYPSATTTSKSTLISSGLPNDFSSLILDGFGRTSQTQHVLPAGTAKMDTTYDPLGRVSSVSNPYFTTADPTYGITQNTYDGLSRTIKMTRQDGSIATAQFTTVSGAVNGTCVINTDEAGKQRRLCHNGFGELVEVDEPSALLPPSQNNYATLQANGNFVLNNSSNLTVWQTGTSGTGLGPLELQDSGNIAVYQFKWQAGTYRAWNGAKSPYDSCFVGDSLFAGQRLNEGQCLENMSNSTFALMTNGDLQMYDRQLGQITWHSNTWATANYGSYLTMQSNGNLVIYSPGGVALWSSGTTGSGANAAELGDDGRLILYSTVWNSVTSQGQVSGSMTHPSCDIGYSVGSTGMMGTGQCLVSRNGRFEWLLQSDGNFVLYDRSVTPNLAIWSTNTAVTQFSPGYAYSTFYKYDPLGNLYCVEQHGSAGSGTGCPATPPGPADSPVAPDPNNAWRRRLFAYDSLSRLRWASNPESGAISYAYDNDSELLQKTSPAPNPNPPQPTQTISYCYDALHRLTGKAYSAQSCPLNSPVLTYTYDSGTNGKGHLTSLSDQAGTGSYSFDNMGRMTTETRSLTGANAALVANTVHYAYNLDGSVKTLTHPSNAVITYTPWNNGTAAVSWPQEAKDLGNNINYVTGATYGPDGSLAGFVNGSGGPASVTNNFSYNKRLQPCRMAAGTSGLPANCADATTHGNVFDITYDFHLSSGDNGDVFGILNNRDHNRDQSFTYDLLNRLITGQNTGPDCNRKTLDPTQKQTAYWGDSYTYDAWGNLLQKGVTKCSAENLSVTTDAQNRIHASGTPDYQYDAAGNMTFNATPPTQSYTYDQENRLTGAAGYTYTYDDEGNRVRKSNGNLAANGTLFWYMTPGVVAESDLAGTLKSEYIFFDGERVARKDFPGNTVAYYFSDHLKTASVITDSAGTIKAESDYYPWGGELQFVNNDSNDYKFTGKERDAESGLDNFGARYYGSPLGRFTSPDPEQAAGFDHMDDPQAWNGYSYVRNNPLRFTDPDGENYHVCDEHGQNCSDQHDKDFEKTMHSPPPGETYKDGKIYLNGEFKGTYQQTDVDLPGDPEANRQAAGMIVATFDSAMKEFGKNAAYAATGTIALRGLGLAAEAVSELGIFKNTNVIIKFSHKIMQVRPGHLPPAGSEMEVASAVEGAIKTGNYVMKGNGIFEGTTTINGVECGFRGRIIGGTAHVATVFAKR